MSKFFHAIWYTTLSISAESLVPASIEASIKKWEYILQVLMDNSQVDSLLDGGPDTCSLCQEYHNHVCGCGDCPVKQKTGQDFCLGSPHPVIERAKDNETLIRGVRSEIEFLKSLEEHGYE